MNELFRQGDYVAIHENPVWREKSDFVVRSYLGLEDGQNQWEQLWAKRIGERRFSICCIPFFAYNLALGDEVQTDTNYTIQSVVQPSGQFTFRVWFGGAEDPSIKEAVLQRLSQMGTLFEWSSANLLGVSASDQLKAQAVANYLHSNQHSGKIVYETGQMK